MRMILLVLTLLLTSCASSLSNTYSPTAQEIQLCSELFGLDIPLVIYFTSDKYAGLYAPDTDHIYINESISGTFLTATLMHECCHAYQIRRLNRTSNLEYEAELIERFVTQYLEGKTDQRALKYMRDNMGISFK
jgi:hypothetical protein